MFRGSFRLNAEMALNVERAGDMRCVFPKWQQFSDEYSNVSCW